MKEKILKSIKVSGKDPVAIGIAVLCVCIAAGILSVLMGANLLKKKSYITF